MKIVNEFTVRTSVDRAWRVLTDLEGIAPCLPGAVLTGVDGDVYQGKVRVKVGPVVADFTGTAQFAEKDDTAHRAVIDAKGRDARSAGNAAALVTAVLRPVGEGTAVTVDTDLKISGKLAQFGSGMIKEVSGKLLAQFVSNLEAKLAAEDAAATAPSAAPLESASDLEAASSLGAVDTEDGVLGSARSAPVGAATPAAAAVRAGGVSSAGPGRPRREVTPFDAEPEPLDLLSIAGGSIYKRLVPVAVGAVVAGAVIAWFVARR